MSAQQKLLNWCKGQTNGYAGVIIENFHLSWRNGLAFCALVHSLAPNCGIVFDQLNADDMIGNNTLAFDSAFKHLGISKLLEPNDMVEGTKPEQFSVMTYLGQFFKKFGTSSRPALTRTNTSPVLMTEEKQKQLAALSDVRQRFGVGKEGDSDVTDSTTVDGKKKRKPMQRTVSTSQIKSPDQMTASEKLKAAKLGEQFKKGGTTEKPANDLVKKCHKSGVSLLGVKAIEWNGQSYHPDHFKCTTCSVAFSKNILNVGNEPYCEKCYRKALVKNKLKKQDTVSGGEPPKINSTTSTTSTEKKDIRDIYEQEEAERLKKIAEESKKAAAESETERKEAESKTPEVVEQKSSIPAWRQKLLERKNATTDAKPEDNKAEKEAAEKKAAEEKATADKLAQEKAAADKKEKDDKEAAEKKAAEEQADKLAQEKAADKLAQEKAAAEKLAQEKAAAEKSAAEKLAQEKAAAEKLAEEKAAAEKLAQEKAASDKLAQEKAAAEKLAQEKAAAEKLSQEKAAAEKKEQERLAQEKAAAEKKAAEEKVEAERIARERAETEKKEQERLAQERAAAEKALAEKLATEKALQEEANRKAAEERKAAEREAEAKAAAEREAAEKLRAEKLLADKLAEEKLEKERIERAAEAERIANEKRKQGDEVAALTGQLDSEKNYSKSLEVEIQRLKDELAALRNDSEQSFNNNIEVTTKLRQENAMLREQISKIQASGHLAETIAAEEKALQEKLAQDKLNQEKAALERQNQYKLEQERKEQERKEQERKEQERKEQERKEQERKEQERNEQEKVEQQKLVFKNDVKPTNTLTSTTSSTALQSAHNRGSDTGVRISCWSCAMLNASRYKFCFNCGSPKDLPTGTTPNNNAEKEAADKLALEKAAAEKLAQEKIAAEKAAAEKAAAEKLAKEKQQQQQNVQLKPTTSSKTPLTQQEYKRPEKVIPEWQRKLLEKKAAQAGQTK